MPADWGRLLTAMITPMAADGAVNEEALAELARALVASGTEGLVVTGTTGESPTLTDEEKVRAWQVVKEAVGADVAVIAGATDNNTARSITLTQEAERIGCDGVLMTVPAYNKPTQEGLPARAALQRSRTHGAEHDGGDDGPPLARPGHRRHQGGER